MKIEKKTVGKSIPKKLRDEENHLYMTKDIYNNYAKAMDKKNQKRKEQGLKAIYIRTFEEWSDI